MADPINTGQKTPTGRIIWNDPETGIDYSERSTTFEIEGKYYTMPTVSEDGNQYTEDQIRDYVKEHGPIDYLTGEKLPEFRYREDAIQYAISRSNTRKPKMSEDGNVNQQTEKAFGLEEGGFLKGVKSFLNYDLNQDAPGNTPIFDRPEPIENPTAGQAITQAINTVPSILKSGVEGVAGLGKKVYEDPNILVKGAETVANIIWNPKDVPFLAAIKSRLLRSTGNFDHVFETNSKTGEIENKVKEIEKPLDDFFALKKEQYGENFLTTLSNEPEIIFSDLLNFTGLGAAGKNAIDSLIPDAKTLKALMTPEPEPKLVPVTANADSTPGSLAEQTESLMPTVRKTMMGPAAVDYQNRALEKAEQMRREGASAEEIFDKTGRVATMRGGEKGYGFGDQFKFEIEDSGILIDDSIPKKIMVQYAT